MLLYSATCAEFYDDVQSTKIDEIVNAAFRREFGRDAGPGEPNFSEVAVFGFVEP
jgi:hypothetical protein